MQKCNMAPPALKPFTSYLPRHGFVEYAQQHLRMYAPEEQHVQVPINALPEDIKEAVEDLQPEIGEKVQTICKFLDELVEKELKKETIKALIGNVKLSTTMYLDSCSGFNYLSMKSWKDLGEPSLDLLDTVEIKDVGANIILCLGALVIPVVLDNIEHTCKLYIWEHECDIIGFGDLKRLGFIGCESIEKKLENCAQVRVPKLSMSFDVSEDFKPCVMPFRKPKPNVHDLVKKRLEEECKLGYLRKIPSKQVSNASPIVVVPKSNGEIRICGDYTRINKRLEEECKLGYLRKIPSKQVSNASPIVVVPKSNGEICICGDYTRINKFIIIPEAHDNILIKNILQLRKKDVRYLSSIDLKDAYKQFTIHGKNRELATINTLFGFYEPLRAVFGIASVPALFNNALADLFNPIPDTYRYFDDIVVISKTESGHRAALSQLFQVLEDNNIVCNCQKSQIMVNSINFLEFCISSDGTIQASNKMKGTILDSPTDSTSLRGALAKMSYARLFIPDFAKLAKSLYPKKNEKFCWTDLKEKQFQQLVQA
uniref:Reverse transcriptase domain-containing protein n=1 Tax=Strongyloides papillosus TaxID=174720 RepID=A0A0N5BDJ5_STREA